MDEVDRLLRAASGLRPGVSPGWPEACARVAALVAAGDLAGLERAWRGLADLRHPTLASMAWRGRVYCGLAGARALVADLGHPPSFEQEWGSRVLPEVYGVLLAHAWGADVLGEVVAAATGDASREALAVATEERVLRDGEVTEPALVAAWRGPASRLVAHPWERGILSPGHPGFRRDTLGNWRARGHVPAWPEGEVAGTTGEGEGLRTGKVWSYDEEFDRIGPIDPPPVGPFADPLVYPNGMTWCVEAWSDRPHPHLADWPFPRDSVDVGVIAAPVSPEALLRQWLWRGLTGGAYTTAPGATRARTLAWASLARLVAEEGAIDATTRFDPDRVARAAALVEVYGFRARGPHVEALGGDLGWIAWRVDGVTWAAVHSDSD